MRGKRQAVVSRGSGRNRRRGSRGVGHWGRGAALAVVLALAATACGGGDDGGSSGSGGGGDFVRVGYDLETQLTDLDPSISNNICDSNLWTWLLDSLLRIDADGNLVPGIATDWQIEPRAITLTLHSGVKYQDGTDLTADTVKQGLEYNSKNSNLESLQNIASMEVVDPTTLKIDLEDPTPLQLLYDLTSQAGMLLAPSSFGDAEEHPVGAGPFMLDSYQPGARMRLVRFPDYFEAGDWKLDGIDVSQVGTGPPAVSALDSGDLDVIRFLAESLADVERIDGAEYSSTPTNEYMQLEFRLQNSVTGEKTPFADERVRQAVSYAINREEINQVVEAGTGVVGAQPYPPGSPYFVEDLADAYSYDPAKARDLLAEAGYSDGFEFEMAIPGGNIANMQRQGDLIRDQLSQVGITANITPILPQDIANDYYLRKQGDAFSAHELPATFPPNILFSNFGKFQFVAIHDGAERDDITELANEAFGATDPAELASITQDMVRISVEHALDVPIANVSWFAAWDTARVAGTPVAPSSACVPIDLRGVSLK